MNEPYTTQSFPMHQTADSQAEHAFPSGQRPFSQSAEHRPPGNNGRLLLSVILFLLGLALVSATGGLYYLDRSYQGKIYPHVTVQGLSVGEMTPDAAEAALRARYSAFLQHPITLTFGERRWEPTIEEVGVSFDFKDAINAAYRVGRGNGLVSNLYEVFTIWRDGLDLPMRVRFDQRFIQQYVAKIGTMLEISPLDAQIRLTGTTVQTLPERIGRQVLVDATVQDITKALHTFTPIAVPLRLREIAPRLSDAAVADARDRIALAIQGPMTLMVEQHAYHWTPEEIGLMLDITRAPVDMHSDRVVVSLNPYQVERRIRRIADETGRGSVNPRVAWNNGNLTIIRPGTAGVRINEERARDIVAASILDANREVVLPVQAVQPQVTEENLHQLGIESLIAVGKSDFTGSAAYRIQNIGVGMKLLNGILIAPNEEFSFNENIGSIDAKNGFVEGYAIIQNRTQLEFGGGICQDSTTLFRAAFWAGLPITERWGHSFYISWYDKYGPTGMDATIFTGGPDLRFQNDTGHWLLIESWSDPKTGVAQIALYGTKLDRQVKLTQTISDRLPAPTEPVYVADAKQPAGVPKQTDHARGGMTIDIYRTITERGVQRTPERFRTKFKPWPNIYVVHPSDLGPDGKLRQQPPEEPAAQPTPVPEQPVPAPEQPNPVPEQATPEPTNG